MRRGVSSSQASRIACQKPRSMSRSSTVDPLSLEGRILVKVLLPGWGEMVFYLPLALLLLHGGSLMTPTLNLADRLLALGTHFRDLGRPHDAHDIFSRLLGFRTLPVEVACQAQLALAEIALKRRRYKTA